jgi:hypothetical protein
MFSGFLQQAEELKSIVNEIVSRTQLKAPVAT